MGLASSVAYRVRCDSRHCRSETNIAVSREGAIVAAIREGWRITDRVTKTPVATCPKCLKGAPGGVTTQRAGKTVA